MFTSSISRMSPKRAAESQASQNQEAREYDRIFAIGDIHGCARELQALLAKINPKSEDLVIFLGDYVDRGPDSRTVIDIILDLAKDTNVVTLKGNHEALFLDFLEQPESVGAGLFILNGGTSTLACYLEPSGSISIPEDHLNFLRKLRLSFQTQHYFFVHAGVPDLPLSLIKDEEHELAMLWSRYPFLSSRFRWEKTIVHGHTPVREAEILPNRVNVDTGCVYDGRLTAIELPSMRLIQVDKGDKNEAPLYPRDPMKNRIAIRFSGSMPVFAAKEGEPMQTFETLNYNEFGLLMRAVEGEIDFQVGDRIDGRIGAEPEGAISFQGEVVRIETRGAFGVLGVKIHRLSGEGTDWGEGTPR